MPYASAELRRQHARLYYRAHREAERVRNAAKYAARSLRRVVAKVVVVRVEESIGPQVVPPGMSACARCDILTAYCGLCGYCVAELVRAEAA